MNANEICLDILEIYFKQNKKMSFEKGAIIEIDEIENQLKTKEDKSKFEKRKGFEILSTLAHGSFGRVYQVKHLQTGLK